MAVSDAILARLLSLHPKIIDLSLDRMWRVLERLGNPQEKLPPVIHIAGTNGKGSTLAALRAILEAAGLSVHCYTSPHLMRFHERIRVAGRLITEERLTEILQACEEANAGSPITFFEITTAAAFLEFSQVPADYVLLETGLGGRLDATNVIEKPKATVITSIGYDHQQYLGETLTQIAGEKAGILRRGVPVVVAPQPREAGDAIAEAIRRTGALGCVSGEEWTAVEQHGRLVFQDRDGLLDLPLPALTGHHQWDNAGTAIATIRALNDGRISPEHMAAGLRKIEWPGRLQRLANGYLNEVAASGMEIWLDGGHNPAAGRVLARALSDLNERHSRPLTIIWGMLNTKDAQKFIESFAGLAHRVLTLTIPGEDNALDASMLAEKAELAGMPAEPVESIEKAIQIASQERPLPRVLICGSLYLAGQVLAIQTNTKISAISGASRPPRP